MRHGTVCLDHPKQVSNDFKQHAGIVELVCFTTSFSMSILSGGDMSVFIGECNVMTHAMLYLCVCVQESF